MKLENIVIDRLMVSGASLLCQAIYSTTMSADKAKELTDEIVLDSENAYYLALLAKAGMMSGYAGFRKDTIPRFQGIFRFHRVRRAINIAKYSKMVVLLQEKGIEFICGRFTSLDFRYCKNEFQTKAVFDIVVHDYDYIKAQELLEGSEECGISESSENGTHSFIITIKICDNKRTWERASHVEKYGVKVLTLSPTDMLELYGSRIWSNCFRRLDANTDNQRTNRMRWLYEYGAILNDDESIDVKDIALHCSRDSKQRIRLLLDYAYRVYGYKNMKQKIMTKIFLPKNIHYRKMLKEMKKLIDLTDGGERLEV